MMSSQKGWGKKVATVNAEWMGSGEIGTAAAASEIQVEASERTSVSVMNLRVLLVPVERVRIAVGRAW